MKITRRQLRQIIKEEIQRITEKEDFPTEPKAYDAWFKKNYVDELARKLVDNGMDSSLALKASKMVWQEWQGHEKANLDRVKAKIDAIKKLQWTMYAQYKEPHQVRNAIHKKVPYNPAKGTK